MYIYWPEAQDEDQTLGDWNLVFFLSSPYQRRRRTGHVCQGVVSTVVRYDDLFHFGSRADEAFEMSDRRSTAVADGSRTRT